jgi:hypothetical protein
MNAKSELKKAAGAIPAAQRNRRCSALRAAARGQFMAEVAAIPLPELRLGKARVWGPEPVFLSYSHKDQVLVRRLVLGLRRRGVALIWDQDLPPGIGFRRAIRDAIDAAPCLIVVWTPSSVGSLFVCDEVARASGKGVPVVPVHTRDLDFNEVPLGYRGLQAVPVESLDRIASAAATHGAVLGH